MQYLLMIYANEDQYTRLSEPQMGERVAAYRAYLEALNEAGVVKSVGRLQKSTDAATVRVTNGKSQVLNGPYTDSKEQLGGFFLIDVPDLDAALSWAARCPGASHGVMEVRPLWPMAS